MIRLYKVQVDCTHRVFEITQRKFTQRKERKRYARARDKIEQGRGGQDQEKDHAREKGQKERKKKEKTVSKI